MVLIYILFENDIPIYIGKTNEPKRRLREHKVNLGKEICLEIIDEVSKSDWKFWEQWWIELFGSWGFLLINRNRGGGGPQNQLMESKKLIGDKQRGIKKPTVSNKLKGQKITWDLGTSIPVLQFSKEGILIKEHKSMGKASIETGASTSSIYEVCRKKRRTAKNFIWVYKHDWDGTKPELPQHKSKGRISNSFGKTWKKQ
jgi:hypothetical protein